MTTGTGSRIKKRQLVHQVIDELQEQISLGHLVPGERLPTEGELTVQLGVSRTTIRESVRVLAHVGLLDVRQGDGTYVRATTPVAEPLDQRLRRSAALEVYEVRRVLELETARLAAQRRTEEDLAVLRRHLAAREKAGEDGDLEALVEADVALHLAVAAAGKNGVLVDLFRTFTGVLRATIADLTRDPALGDTSELHRMLVNAIAEGDAAAAVDATTRLLEADARGLRRELRR